MNQIPEITVRDLNDMKQKDEDFLLLDVRRQEERDIANIDGTLIPIDELPQRLDELEEHRNRKIVVYCHSGGRSSRAVQFLQSMGYDAVNLRGGITAWSREVDPNTPIY